MGNERVAVVGGGIAGLAAALRLRERLGPGATITIFEQGAALGGKLRTGELAGGAQELGAETFLAGDPAGGESAAVSLARRVGLGDRLVHPGTTQAALVIGGALTDIPTGTLMGVPEDAARVASVARVTEGRDPDQGRPLLGDGEDVAIGALTRRRFGDEVVDRLVDPLLGGVYAGRADELSLDMTVPGLARAARTERTLSAAVKAAKAASARARAAGAALAQTGPERAGSASTGSASAGSSRTGSARAGAAQPGSARTGTAQASSAQAGGVRAGGVQAGTANSVGVQAGPAWAGGAQAGIARAGGAQAGDAQAGLAEAGAAPGGRAGVPPIFATVDGGLSRLVVAVADAAKAEVRLGLPVRALERAGDGGWVLTVGAANASDAAERHRVDAVVLAVPARAAARLLKGVDASVSGVVGGLDYASIALINMALPAAELPHLSGLLIPSVEGLLIKAATFFGVKWPHLRRADGVVQVRASIGRHGEEHLLQRDDAELVTAAHTELSRLLGGRLPAPIDTIVQRWGGALPQYAPGHRARITSARETLRAGHPTIVLAGASYDGVGIPLCVRSGESAADELADVVQRSAVSRESA
ncbi:oxygen-dependent protoporphyrinogen oxidase [Catenuloplanes nepalensis]|uniref:Coproporphyrinogen III oxidase n=1 Tax=Catenuloplanes nepalensis TaxID=587533 RepID=A0ABT9MZR6_9ACTN|nr:protoporphyrinogen oxidase [Catenuloplanes nepalensis]MDP9796932.1 oxygen-dependent protoporphyrinogen oxidase [Catenuloplanes nepalensis]